ncbi:hypothetical protein [Entomohabitans teleogrylli]|uniref:hypothetical protein n=1 Tax=Entomohabitans teleogrylli TaxID=1384589 RepID=UPI00073D3720|nr:hypothetical protein [Entomohabitans teleogrylli]
MVDSSLLFFYGFIGLVIIYLIFSFVRRSGKWSAIIQILSLIACMLIPLLFVDFGSGLWVLSTIILTLLASLAISIIVSFTNAWLTGKELNQTISAIHDAGIAAIAEKAGHEAVRCGIHIHWYVVYFPSQDLLEIGINQINVTPRLGSKFYVKTLAGRVLYLTPEYIVHPINDDIDMVCSLNEFYSFSDKTKSLVDNYILAIKDNVPEPWQIKNAAVGATENKQSGRCE